MTRKLFQIINKFGNPEPLMLAKGVMAKLPMEKGRTLEKNNLEIVDAKNSIIALEVSDFEIQGLIAEKGQNFIVEVQFPGRKVTALFKGELNIRMEGERKVWK